MKKFNEESIYVLQNHRGWVRIVCIKDNTSWHVPDEEDDDDGGPSAFSAKEVLTILEQYKIIQEWK